jgi:hypothetical protein
LLIGQDFTAFFIGCGAYTAFLLLYSMLCWFDVPKELRKRPGKPSDFGVLQLGRITPEAARVIGDSPAIKDQVFESVRHQLILVEHNFREGTWRSYIEIADDRILAYSTSYESASSPVLDCGEQHGAGRFLTTPD